jgi:hypothetical protein
MLHELVITEGQMETAVLLETNVEASLLLQFGS